MTLLTESAAREKWCPFARVLVSTERNNAEVEIASAHNRLARATGQPDTAWGKPYASACIASDCMAWRWDDTAQGQRRGERQGFCGLAGDPVVIVGAAP